jgi:hypothetical protein
LGPSIPGFHPRFSAEIASPTVTNDLVIARSNGLLSPYHHLWWHVTLWPSLHLEFVFLLAFHADYCFLHGSSHSSSKCSIGHVMLRKKMLRKRRQSLHPKELIIIIKWTNDYHLLRTHNYQTHVVLDILILKPEPFPLLSVAYFPLPVVSLQIPFTLPFFSVQSSLTISSTPIIYISMTPKVAPSTQTSFLNARTLWSIISTLRLHGSTIWNVQNWT